MLISEDFYSIQCEGISTGYPAYFVRLANCNLSCGASAKFLQQVRKGEYDPGNFKGDLHESGQATWTCDTIPVWLRGTEQNDQYLINRWKEQGIYEDVCNGIIHVIFTGGEPTLPKHQDSIIDFIDVWHHERRTGTFPEKKEDMYPRHTCLSNLKPFIEIETNGTIYIKTELFNRLTQVNCSPKLKNSGNSDNLRYKPEAIKRIMEHPNYQFKFVISKEEDLQEIFDDYINKFNMPLNRVVCMPGLDSRENFHERTRFVLEMAKKYRFIGLTRLHVSAWDKTVGV